MLSKYGWIASAALLVAAPVFAQTGAIMADRPADKSSAASTARAPDRTMATDKKSIKDAYKADRERCDTMKGNAKDVCQAEAKAKRDIALAEADAAGNNTPAAQRKVALAKADGEYKVAREKCDDLKGNEKDACVKDARANRDKARAEAMAHAKVGEARQDAAKEHREAAQERAKDRS